MYFFTSDQHFGHENIIRFCNRPFSNALEMDEEIIKRFNEVVKKGDICIHAGDFAFRNKIPAGQYIDRLNGLNLFVKGSHDKWLKNGTYMVEVIVNKQPIVVCHYAMLTWPRSHYGSWQLFGHSHGKLPLEKYNKDKQYDIGVDSNNFYPVSMDTLMGILK